MASKPELRCSLCYINKHLISMHSGTHKLFRYDLIEIIKNLTNIAINRDDLITKFCLNCSITACNFYMFKYTCINNYKLCDKNKKNDLNDLNSDALDVTRVEAVKNWLNQKCQYKIRKNVDNCSQTDDIKSDNVGTQTTKEECISVKTQTDPLNGNLKPQLLFKSPPKYWKSFIDENTKKSLSNQERTIAFDKLMLEKSNYKTTHNVPTNNSHISKKVDVEVNENKKTILSQNAKHEVATVSNQVQIKSRKHSEKKLDKIDKKRQHEVLNILESKAITESCGVAVSKEKTKSKKKKHLHLEKDVSHKKCRHKKHSKNLDSKKNRKTRIENHSKEQNPIELNKKNDKMEAIKELIVDLERIDYVINNNNNNNSDEPNLKKIKL